MTDPNPSSVRSADEIARPIAQLTDRLAQSPPKEAAQILGTVLDYDDGILGQVTALVATGSRFAQDRSRRSLLAPEVWLAPGRAANELDSVGVDLDEHTAAIKQLAARTAPTSRTAVEPGPVGRLRR